MDTGFVVLHVLLVGGAVVVDGGILGGYGGYSGGGYVTPYSGGGGYVAPISGGGGYNVISPIGGGGGYVAPIGGGGGYVAPYSGGGSYLCGGVQCITEFQCDSCDYPQQFIQQVSYSRSVLSRVEEFVQTVGRVGINANSRMVNTAIAIPAGFVEMSTRNGMMLVSDISTAIENLSVYVNHQVVGRVAYDVISDLSDSLSVVRKLVGWCGSVNGGNIYIPIPQDIVIRYQQPRVWNNQCVGTWPCTTLVPYTSSQGAQSQYSNKYGYSKQYSHGNTQIVNSNYDSGNSYGYGDTGSAAQNYNYQSGATPSYGSGGGGYGAGLISGYGLGGARALGDGKRSRKGKSIK